MGQLQIEYVPISEIIPYWHNAKSHDSKNVKHIANSIREFGFRQPIAIDADGVIICGHGRHLAALELGLTEVPCVRITDLDDEKIRAYRLADNKTNESEWLDDILFEELEAIDLDMNLYGFDFQTLDDSLNSGQHQIDLSESWEVVIECNSEDEQQQLYNRMTEEGWKCRLSTL